MRIILLLSVVVVSCSVFAQTYRSGGTYKAHFGAQQAQSAKEEGDKKASAPGANSAVKTRTFTNYGARRQWGKGVQTQAVQTATAGTAAPEPTEDMPIPAAEQKLNAAVKKGSAKSKGDAANAAAQPAAQAPAAQPAEIPAEAAAAMQQMQGLQDMLKGLGAAGDAAQPGAAMPAMPAGMNVPGMPDMSALMGGAAAGAGPAAGKQPGKK